MPDFFIIWRRCKRGRSCCQYHTRCTQIVCMGPLLVSEVKECGLTLENDSQTCLLQLTPASRMRAIVCDLQEMQTWASFVSISSLMHPDSVYGSTLGL